MREKTRALVNSKVFTGLLLAVLLGLSLQANAILVTTDIEFDTSQSLVEQDESISMHVNFGGTFDKIDKLTFIFEFADDLFDPGDRFRIGWFPDSSGVPVRYAYGASNSMSASQPFSMISLISLHGGVDTFLDGAQSFNFSMPDGSVNLSNAYVTADGSFNAQVSEPSTGFLLLLGVLAMFGLQRKTKN